MSIMKPLLWVEGIIGCGKTTFAYEVGKRLNFQVIEEPVVDNPYLEHFYKDPKTHATMMQIYLLFRRYALQQMAALVSLGVNEFKGAILDRSLSGDRVFARLHRNEGNISQLDWETYEMCYNLMCHSLLPPTRLIFLDAQPITAYNRMKKRARSAEDGVPLEYLQKLRKGYQDLLKEAERGLMPWGHAVKTTTIIWDPMNDMPDWDAVASTVLDACRS
jgi:deoxyadenosine/deoxycytidine kinase